MLLRNVQLVPLAGPVPREPVDVRIAGPVVGAVGVPLSPLPGEEVLDADGRWLIPGLWDAHVHLGQWARRHVRLDLAGSTSVAAALTSVAAAVAALPPGAGLLIGGGYRPATWPQPPPWPPWTR